MRNSLNVREKRFFPKIGRYIYDSSLVLYLPFRELDGASFMSRDAYGHLCVVTGALWRPSGRYFDGTDDKVVVGDSTTLNLGTGDCTILAWIKNAETLAATSNFYAILAKHGTGAYWSFGLRGAGNYGLWLVANDGATSQSATIPSTYTSLLSDGNYHRVAVVRLNTVCDFWIDGINRGHYSTGIVTHSLTNTNTPAVGLAGFYGGGMFKGVIPEVIAHNRALTPLEMQNDYTQSKWRYR